MVFYFHSSSLLGDTCHRERAPILQNRYCACPADRFRNGLNKRPYPYNIYAALCTSLQVQERIAFKSPRPDPMRLIASRCSNNSSDPKEPQYRVAESCTPL